MKKSSIFGRIAAPALALVLALFSLASSGAGLSDVSGPQARAAIRSAVADWKFTPYPSSAPVPSVGTAGALTGTYFYQVAFRTAAGSTEGGVPSAGVTVAGQRITLASVPVSADPAVIARDVYRTKAGAVDSILGFYVGTIADNTTTTYTDNTPDASLGAPVPKSNATGGYEKRNGALVAYTGPTSTQYGYNSNPQRTGYATTALGTNAGRSNINGYRWVAVGMDALEFNQTGARGVAVGVHASGSQVSADDTTSVGYGALQNSLASYNTALGSLASSENTTGDNNLSAGAFALQLNTTGSNIVALGASSQKNLLNGIGNTSAGAFSSYFLQGGNFNTNAGFQAGYKATNTSNQTAYGALSLWSNLTGQGNVAMGPWSGYWETGDNHLWIDNQPRANLADAQTKALIYGTFAVGVDGQQMTVNGQLNAAAGFALKSSGLVTSNYTMQATDSILKFVGTASITVTLLTGPPQTDRIIRVKNYAAFPVVSNAANIIPLTGGAPTTAILPATAGKWADLQFNGTQWEILASN